MDSNAAQPTRSPDRSEAIPESYAVYVTDRQIQVWQYRVDVSAPDGKWHFVETLDRADDPRLSVDHATLMPPTADGYWIHCKSYDCELDCE